MFGFACDETPELMPLPISLAHALVRRQAALRRSGALPWLRPDAKSQVTVRYRGDQPLAVEKVVLSTQHSPEIDGPRLEAEVRRHVIEPVIPERLRSRDLRYLINPTGRFEIGGPVGDTGLTGRKIIVDTYGGSCPHGGGAFSGKDPTKVDRSAAYAARQVAKTIVAAGLARRCTVQVAYAIGVAEPVSLLVETHGTGRVPDEAIESAVQATFDLRPAGIIGRLQLRRPIYGQTAAYGHFGREGVSWEDTSLAGQLRELAGAA
jgi:S-adenosylmethionine synthetase